MLKLAIPLALLAGSGAALAHPGHDAALAEGAAHWLGAPGHWIVLALASLAAVELARRAALFLAPRRAPEEDTAP